MFKLKSTLAGVAFALVLTTWGWSADRPVPEMPVPPGSDAIKAKVFTWAEAHGTDAAGLAVLQKVWGGEAPKGAEALLERVVQSFSAIDPATRQFVDKLHVSQSPLSAPDISPILDSAHGEFYLSNMRFYTGRYLAQRQMFDESLELLGIVDLKEVVDPAGCLFFKASCEKRLMLKKESLASLAQLLKNTTHVPSRYVTVATLMQHDLKSLEDKSLDEISWKMEDVERRLNLARTGVKTQKVEGEIIAALDEIIKKIEEQSGGASGGKGSQNSQNQSGSPADDSRVKGSTAPGEVDKRKLKGVKDWGNLDEKARARVKNMISRDFPAHYRQAIEEYFKKLATEESGSKK